MNDGGKVLNAFIGLHNWSIQNFAFEMTAEEYMRGRQIKLKDFPFSEMSHREAHDFLVQKKLEGNDYFCCLGVLCELAVKEGIIEPGKTKGENVYYSRKSYQVLPKKVQLWAGLKTNVGDFKDTYSEGSLADLNDGGTPFSEIATIIENTPKGLFKGEK